MLEMSLHVIEMHIFCVLRRVKLVTLPVGRRFNTLRQKGMM